MNERDNEVMLGFVVELFPLFQDYSQLKTNSFVVVLSYSKIMQFIKWKSFQIHSSSEKRVFRQDYACYRKITFSSWSENKHTEINMIRSCS